MNNTVAARILNLGHKGKNSLNFLKYFLNFMGFVAKELKIVFLFR